MHRHGAVEPQITANPPVIMAAQAALEARTASGYPIVWDMTLADDSDKAAASARMRNLAQLIYEQQRAAGFIMLQGIPDTDPARKTLLDALNAELAKTDVHWKIAGDPGDKTVLTLFNTRLFKLEAAQPKQEDLPDDLSDKTTAKDRVFHYFEAVAPAASIGQKRLVANMGYKGSVTANEVVDDHEKLLTAYGAAHQMIFAGKLGNVTTATTLLPGGYQAHSSAASPSGMIIADAIGGHPGHFPQTHYNHPKIAVPRAQNWEGNDIEVVLEKTASMQALRLQWLPHVESTVTPEVLNLTGDTLRVFAQHIPSSYLLDNTQGNNYMASVIQELVASFKRAYPAATAANIPSHVRLAIPINWQSAAGTPEHFTPLCLDIELNQATFAALVNNPAKVTVADFRACIQNTTAIHPETTAAPYLNPARKTTLEMVLNTSFKPTAHGAVDIDIQQPPVRVRQFARDGNSAGHDCGPLTAMTAQRFFEHGDVNIEQVPVPADLDIADWPNLAQLDDDAVWSDDLKKRYQEESSRFLEEQRRLYMLKQDVGRPKRMDTPDASTPQRAASFARQAKGREHINAGEKLFQSLNLERKGDTVYETRRDGGKTPILNISTDKEGNTTIMAAQMSSGPQGSPGAVYPNGVKLIQASLAVWLKKGVTNINVESANHMQLWMDEAKKVGIEVTPINAAEAAPPTKSAGGAPPMDMEALRKMMPGV